MKNDIALTVIAIAFGYLAAELAWAEIAHYFQF